MLEDRLAVNFISLLVMGISLLEGCTSSNGTYDKQLSRTERPKSNRESEFWCRAREEVYKSKEEILGQHKAEKRRGTHYPKIIHGDRRYPQIALTFDDGPHPGSTLQILSILKQYKASATFFVVGKMAEKYPDLIRAIHRGGHVVGNHTYHHVNLTKIPVKEIIVEWEACNEVIQSITGKRPQYARPPGGDYDRRVMDAAKRAGLNFVLWTENVGDYLRPSPQKIESTLLRNASNGDIFLLHDGVPETLHALPFLLSQLKRKGFTLVNMDQMRKVPH